MPDVVAKGLSIHGGHHVDIPTLGRERSQLLNEPLDVSLFERYAIAQDIIPKEDRQGPAVAPYLVDNVVGPGHRTGYPAEYQPAVSRFIDGPGDFMAVAHLRAEEADGCIRLAEVALVGLVVLQYLAEHLVLGNQGQNGVIFRGTDELQPPHLRQFLQPINDIRHAMLIQHLGEDGIDVHRHFSMRLLMKEVHQWPVGLVAYLLQHAVELS